MRVVTSDTPRLSNDEPLPSAAELRERKLILFYGEAVKVRPVPTGDPASDEYFAAGSLTTFLVLGHWENEMPLEVIVQSGWPGGQGLSGRASPRDPGTRTDLKSPPA